MYLLVGILFYMYEGHSLEVDLLELLVNYNEIMNGILANIIHLINFLRLIEEL